MGLGIPFPVNALSLAALAKSVSKRQLLAGSSPSTLTFQSWLKTPEQPLTSSIPAPGTDPLQSVVVWRSGRLWISLNGHEPSFTLLSGRMFGHPNDA
jgi:hypothetical protein